MYYPCTLLLLLIATVHSAQAQYRFDPSTYDADGLFSVISRYYSAYQSTWDKFLDDASASFPGAYSQLTAYFATDQLPSTFDPAYVSQLAKHMYDVGKTTIVDSGVNPSTLVFVTPTSTPMPTQTPTPTRASTSAGNTARPLSTTSTAGTTSTASTVSSSEPSTLDIPASSAVTPGAAASQEPPPPHNYTHSLPAQRCST
ncbi:hypothetical protein GQ54DRAFT_79742 [Martensiomyces pterosporus]|nr:hypothetical protein GQ54DRAFT_79742 [Martensiomyces pterosporus]